MPLRGSDCFVFVVISPSPGAQEMKKGDWALFYFGNMRVTEEDQTLVLSPYSLPLVQGLHAVSVPYSSSILLTHHLQRECRQHQERSMWVCEPGERWTAAFGALFPNSAHRTQWDNVDHSIALWLYRDVTPIDPSCIFLRSSYSSLFKLPDMMGPVAIYFPFYVSLSTLYNVWEPLFAFLIT